jgi:CPA2 family monovalent cation:H+ antiporter-2
MRLLDVRGTEDAGAEQRRDHVVIAGFGVTGQELARSLRDYGVPYVVADLNAENVRAAARAGEPVYYGDIASPEVLAHLGAERAREVILVVNDPAAAERAVLGIRRIAPHVHVLARTRYIADIEAMLRAGADEVVPAETEAAVEVAVRVLARHGFPRERVESGVARIRARRGDRYVPDAASDPASRARQGT